MAVWQIPDAEGRVRQLGLNDTFGELWSSFNIDLHTNPGKIKLATPLKLVVNNTTLSGERVEALAMYNSSIYAVTNTEFFRSITPPYTSWNLINNTPSAADDAVVFGGQLVIGTSQDLDAWNGALYTSDWWTALAGDPPLESATTAAHVFEVLHIGTETLTVTNGNKVEAYTGPIAGPGTFVTVDLGTGARATCVKGSIDKAWIGSYTESGDTAYVYEWDGASSNYDRAYPIGAKAVLAMEIDDNVPLIVTERGEIKKFNGAGFTTVAQFPFASKPIFADGVETGLIQNNPTSRPVHPKGMKRVGNIVYIFTNFANSSNTDTPIAERTPGGIWALDLTNYSLTHLASPDGQMNFDASSPLLIINDPSGRIFVGGEKNIGSNRCGVWLEDLAATTNYGYFVTPELESGNVQDVYDEIVAKALVPTSGKIEVKYRTTKDNTFPLLAETVSWTSTTVFTTTTDLSYVKTRYDAGERDEVEVFLGQGSGRLAHVSSITYSAPTYTVTVDETIGSNGTTASLRFDNWKKVPVSMTTADGELKRMGVGKPGTWAQFKVALTGSSGLPEIRSMTIKSNAKEEL
jgi:hypothetical protein